MIPFNPDNYGPAFAPFLAIDRRRPLDAGNPNRSARSALQSLSVEHAFGKQKLADHQMAECCISGLWLLHDFLDESHTISQRIDTATGSYWHAIMHRREGDFSNSKYWYRHVGRHPVFTHVAEKLNDDWDPFDFVDQCQAVERGKSGDHDRCLDIQQLEWELLFDYCYRTATGG